MPKESLKASLAEFQAALEGAEFKDPKDRERLDALLADIEVQADAPQPFAQDKSILGALEETILNLELEHPTASSVLQRILQLARTLGDAGI